jgi:hypothetical protein
MSDDFVSGFIEEFYCSSGKNGDFWKITVNGESYGFGKYPPKCGEDSEVEFYIRWNGDYPNVDLDTFNIINAVGNGPSNGGGGGGNRGGGQRGGGQGRGGQSQGRSQGGGNRSQGGQGGSRGNQSQGRSGGQGGNGGSRAPAGRGAAQGGSSRPAGNGGVGAGKDQYWADKEKRDIITQKAIQLQASRNSAIAVLGVLLSNGAVALPTAKAKQYDAVMDMLAEITERFQEETSAVMNPSKGRSQQGGRGQNGQDDDLPDDELPEFEEEQQ